MLNIKINKRLREIEHRLNDHKGREGLNLIFSHMTGNGGNFKLDLRFETALSLVLIMMGFSFLFFAPEYSQSLTLLGSITTVSGMLIVFYVFVQQSRINYTNKRMFEMQFFDDFKMETLNPEREFYNINKIFGNLIRSGERNAFMNSYLSHEYEIALHKYHYGSKKDGKYDDKVSFMAVAPVKLKDTEIHLMGLPCQHMSLMSAMMDNLRLPNHTCSSTNVEQLSMVLDSTVPNMIMASEKILGNINLHIKNGFMLVEWETKSPFLGKRNYDLSDLENFKNEVLHNEHLKYLDFSLVMFNNLRMEIEKTLTKK